jgi:hypothetical protein
MASSEANLSLLSSPPTFDRLTSKQLFGVEKNYDHATTPGRSNRHA